MGNEEWLWENSNLQRTLDPFVMKDIEPRAALVKGVVVSVLGSLKRRDLVLGCSSLVNEKRSDHFEWTYLHIISLLSPEHYHVNANVVCYYVVVKQFVLDVVNL